MLVVKLPGFLQNAKHINSQFFQHRPFNKLFNNSCISFTVYDLCYGTLEGKDVRTLAAKIQKKGALFLYYVADISGPVKVSKGTNKSTDKFREEADTSVFHNQQSLNSCVSGTEG